VVVWEIGKVWETIGRDQEAIEEVWHRVGPHLVARAQYDIVWAELTTSV